MAKEVLGVSQRLPIRVTQKSPSLNENENTTYGDMRYVAKAALRGKFAHISKVDGK